MPHKLKYFKTIHTMPKFDYRLLNRAVDGTLQKLGIEFGELNQICLTTIPGHEHDYLLGAGSLEKDWSNKIVHEDGSFTVPMRDTPLKDSDFTILCEQFKGTIFEVLYKSIANQFKVGRVRLMLLPPKTVMTWHKDATTRLHLALKTQGGCNLVVEDETVHMPPGTWWAVNTTLPHTAFNASMSPRIHLVAALLDYRIVDDPNI